jgi:hypothetical protein
MKKEQTTINTMDKELEFAEVVEILEQFKGKDVIINSGTIYEIDQYENFDVWLDGINNDILVLYNGDGTERSKMIRKDDYENYYIDAFMITDNIVLNLQNGNWIQVYEQ